MLRRLAFISMMVLFAIAYATTGKLSRSAVGVLRIGETEISAGETDAGLSPEA